MTTAKDVLIIKAEYIPLEPGTVVKEAYITISITFRIERFFPVGYSAFWVVAMIKGTQVKGLVFVPDGQLLVDACAQYFSNPFDVTKAAIDLPANIWN